MTQVYRRSLMLAAAMAIGFAATAPSAEAEPGEFVEGVLQPLEDGFPSRPITLINVDDPGTRDGIYARSMQKALEAISPVDILVSDEPAPTFGTYYTLNDTKTRDGGKEGYYPVILTVPGSSTDTLMEPIEKELGMTVEDLNIVTITETIPFALIQRKDAPWGNTFEDLVSHIRENPGEVKYISVSVGSGPDLTMEWIMREIGGLEVQKIPADGSTAAATVVAAGEGDFTLSQAPLALQHWQAGRADPVLFTGGEVPEPWTDDPNVVAADDYGLPPAPWGAVLGFAVPKETSPEHVDWLYRLFKAGAETEIHMQREKTVPGTNINVIGPEEANALKYQIIEFIEPVVRDLNLHIDQQ